MKKLTKILVLLLILPLLFVVSCSTTSDGGTNEQPPVEQNPSVDEKPTLNDFKDVHLKGATFEYDGQVHSLVVEGELPKGTTVEYTNNDQINAGVYEVSATLSCEGYNTLTLKEQLTITKKNVDIQFLDQTFIYDGTEKEITIVGTLPEGVTVSYENNKLTDAGKITATAYFTQVNENYNIPESLTAVLEVTTSNIDIQFNDYTTTYDGSIQKMTISSELPSFVSVWYENNYQVNAGEYIVTAYFTSTNSNYTVPEKLTAKFIINKADYNVTFNDEVFTYDGFQKEITLPPHSIPDEVNVRYENNKHTNAGEYIATVYLSSDNYNVPEKLTAKLTINKAQYNINFNNGEFTYNGYEHVIKINQSLPDGVTVRYENNKLTNAGEVIATAYITNSNPNYIIPEKLTAKLTVNKANCNISFQDETWTYSDYEYVIKSYSYIPEGVTVRYENNKHINAGEYIATMYLTSDNYNVPEKLTAKLTILPQEILLSFDDLSCTYDGREREIVIHNTLPAGVSIKYENNKHKNAGEYVATAYISNTNSNYTVVSKLTAKLTINKADLCIHFNDKQSAYNGLEQDIVINDSLPENITVRYENNKLTDVGEIIATAYIDNMNPNYNVPDRLTAKLTITKGYCNICFDNLVWEYDGYEKEIKILDYYLKGDIKVRYENNKHTNAGEYIATAYLSSKNYDVPEKLTAKLTIKKAEIDLSIFASFEDKVFRYTGNEWELLASYPENLFNVIYENNKITNPGSKKATATFTLLDTKNYLPLTNNLLEAEIKVEFRDLQYTITDKGVVINKYLASSYYVGKLPDTIDNLKVIEISDYAFADLSGGIMILPDSITTIGAGAFKNSNLFLENLPTDLVTIGDDAFFGFQRFGFLQLPSNLKYIGKRAFMDSGIDNIEFPYGLLKIDDEAFYGKHFKKITIPATVEYVGVNAFYIVKTIYCDDTFIKEWNQNWIYDDYGCNIITSFTGNYHKDARGVVYALKNVNKKCWHVVDYLGDNPDVYIADIIDGYRVCNIDEFAFADLKHINSITLTSATESIGMFAFERCFNLKNVYIEEGLQYIGDYAFNATKIETINLPNTLVGIGIGAFRYTRLTRITIPNGIKRLNEQLFDDCSELTSVTLPSQLTNIHYNAFRSCTSLTTIIIPKSVTYIDNLAFSDCTNLKTIYCEATEKPLYWLENWLGNSKPEVIWGYKPKQ